MPLHWLSVHHQPPRRRMPLCSVWPKEPPRTGTVPGWPRMPFEDGGLVVAKVGSCALRVHQSRYSPLAHHCGLRAIGPVRTTGIAAAGTPMPSRQSSGLIDGNGEVATPRFGEAGFDIGGAIGGATVGVRTSVTLGPEPTIRGAGSKIGAGFVSIGMGT